MDLHPKQDFIEKHIPYKVIRIITLNDFKMFIKAPRLALNDYVNIIKAPRLALNDYVNISQIIKHKQNFMFTKVSNLETVCRQPKLFKGSCHDLHFQKWRY